MQELAAWHESRHDPPVEGEPDLGRPGSPDHGDIEDWFGSMTCRSHEADHAIHGVGRSSSDTLVGSTHIPLGWSI